jgi:hypothetical protein
MSSFLLPLLAVACSIMERHVDIYVCTQELGESARFISIAALRRPKLFSTLPRIEKKEAEGT